MKIKNYAAFAAFTFLLSCSGPKVHIPSAYEKKPVFKSDTELELSPTQIEEAGDLADEFPEENMIYNKINMVIDFKFNENYDAAKFHQQYLAENRKADSLAKLNKNKISKSKTPELTVHPIPDGEIFMNTKNEFDFTNIRDFEVEPIALYYNSMITNKGVYFKINGSSFSPKKTEKSFDGATYFKTDSRYTIYSINAPVRGSEISYEYNQECRDAKFNSYVYIPEEHFTQKKVIKIAMPEFLNFDIIEKNFGNIKFEKDTVTEYPSFGDKSKKVKYLRYTFKRLKPISKTILSRGPSYDYPMLYFQFKTATKGDKTHNILRTKDDLYEWYKLVNTGLNNDTSVFAAHTRELVKGLKTDEEKIKKVFYWIQDNIRYIAFEDGIAGFRPDECADVYRKRYGDCKGMANLTKNMLKVLGYDARIVWIGTKHQNFSYDQPGMPVDNHCIAAVKLNGKWVFLDGTENFVAMYDYANRIQGRRCIIENGASYYEERIPEWDYKHNEENRVGFAEINGDQLNVKITQTFNGESKLSFIREYNYLEQSSKEEVLNEYLSNNNVNFKISKIQTTDLQNRDLDPKLTYELSIKDQIVLNNNKLYINLDWDQEFHNLQFDTNRTADIDFGHKNYVNNTLTLKLKEGQKVLKLPQDIHIDNEYYTFILEVHKVGNTLVYKKVLINKFDYLPADYIKIFNKDTELITKFYNSYIILTNN